MYDLIVVGAGIAGVSAALYAKSRGLDVLVLEKDKVGGLIRNVSLVSHYASAVGGETGEDFAKRLEDQLKNADIEVKNEEVKALTKGEDSFSIKTDKGDYQAEKVVVASGSSPKELDIERPQGFEFYHWALGREDQVKDKTVIVNGGSDGACKEAIYLAKYAKQVHIVQVADKLLCIDEFKKKIQASDNIEVHCNSELKEVKAENGKITQAVLSDASIEDENGIEVYVLVGQSGNSDFLQGDFKIENGFVQNGDGVETEIEGLFLAGDIRVKDVRQLATAVCDGCLAGIKAAK
ncbi:MAG: NAD(P)/FAD-dependent oxidoreductase [Finegoldia sp.]|nr:NAD(P)/FAD-dependent oxidoreductase [Finegoldia sp.]